MPTLIEKQVFSQHSYRLPTLVENVHLAGCKFESCQNPLQRTIRDRPTFRNVSLAKCHVTLSDLGPFVAEDCLIDTITLHTGKWGPQSIEGSLFRHVVLRGRVTGSAWLTAWAPRAGMAQDDPRKRSWIEDSRRFYEKVDWALDISQAEFTSFDLDQSGIPARLVRRDPETQAVMSRTVAESGRWKQILEGHPWKWGIRNFLDFTPFEDVVLIAARRGRYFESEMEAIRRLRADGLLEPD